MCDSESSPGTQHVGLKLVKGHKPPSKGTMHTDLQFHVCVRERERVKVTEKELWDSERSNKSIRDFKITHPIRNHEGRQKSVIPPNSPRQYKVDKMANTQHTRQALYRQFTHLNEMMLGWLSFRRCLMSVSLTSLTFFTATCCWLMLPRNTAPWAPLPNHCKSHIFSNGISQSSGTKMALTLQYTTFPFLTALVLHPHILLPVNSSTSREFRWQNCSWDSVFPMCSLLPNNYNHWSRLKINQLARSIRRAKSQLFSVQMGEACSQTHKMGMCFYACNSCTHGGWV